MLPDFQGELLCREGSKMHQDAQLPWAAWLEAEAKAYLRVHQEPLELVPLRGHFVFPCSRTSAWASLSSHHPAALTGAGLNEDRKTCAAAETGKAASTVPSKVQEEARRQFWCRMGFQ